MLKLRILVALAVAFLFSPVLHAAGSVIILDYHTFLGTGPSFLDWSEAELAAQLDRMKAMGYTFVTLEDAIAGKVKGKANIVITIDDGNHTVYHAVKTVFEPRGIKPYLFVYAGIINTRKFAIKTDQLRELMADGCGVGAHGWFHEYMTPAAYKKDAAKVMLEVNNAGPALQKISGQKPTTFAYPFGVGCPEAEAGLVKNGYDWIFLAGSKVVPVDFSNPAIVRTQIPRIMTFRWDGKKLLQTLADYLK